MKQKEWIPDDEVLLHILLDLQTTSSTEAHFNSDYYSQVLEQDPCSTSEFMNCQWHVKT